jgi:radical SAM protein with 4Fe4S-binding SPASM domain
MNAICSRVWLMSNIFSNGDVVPCCYDYNAEMKVGNIRHQRFSKIWNSPEYRALREKIYHDKDSFAKCKACGCNYELTPNGWFVESIDFNNRRPLREKFRKYFKYCPMWILASGKKKRV